MIKKTIKYEDFDGNKREEDFMFGLTKAEIAEIELSIAGGLEKTLEKIINTQDQAKLISLFKELIIRSYGEKSDDGKRFIKNSEISEGFTQTNAYSELFMELVTDTDSAIKFIIGILPKEMSEEANKAIANIDINNVKTIGDVKALTNN